MDGNTIELAAIIVSNTAILWYKLGKLESKVKGLCERIARLERLHLSRS